MDLVHSISTIRRKTEADIARILILLLTFAGKKIRTRNFKGLTKLAKLDFLLRYPLYLHRLLKSRISKPKTEYVKLYPFERECVEAEMIRYHYGPWDPKHKLILNHMVGLGLIRTTGENPVNIRLTVKGAVIADVLSKNPQFKDTIQRSKLLKLHLNFTGTTLKKILYEKFPEILNLRKGQKIPVGFDDWEAY